ncbi:MAG: DNA polymerase I [Desulfomonile tiedjei]|uniref:DNA polymerase I n=1 Tax=Desulfomonile tiedjei TaxID=2358 RepID=A0A9D6V258_9BACT|nr:DNA polymerase I [Desulfomonile tiedjei]
MTKKNEEIYLIDGSSYIYRAYHAMGGLSNSKGFPTGAILGFCNMIAKTMKDRLPTRIAIVFDAKGPNFRHEMYPAYKANRPPVPEDLRVQIPKIQEIVEAYRIPSIAIPGFEADDVIATLSREAREKGWEVVIVSGDKDLTQLVGSGTLMWDPQKDVLYDREGVAKKFGVPPELILEYLALVGDASDNIPGVPGIGPKTASNLLQQFGSLEGLYSSLDQVSQKKVKENLANNKDKALLSQKLASLCDSVPIDLKLEDMVIVEQDSEKLREIFKELEFKRLMEELPAQRTLDFSGYCTIITMEDLLKWVEDLKRVGKFAVDLETTSTEPVRARLVGISMCAENGKACYIPVGHTYGAQLNKEEVLSVLRPILEDETIGKYGQNIKYDMIVLKKDGVDIRGIICDTMLASYLLDPSRRGHSLDDLAETLLEHRTIKITELIGTGKKQILFSDVDIDSASEYACEDAEVTCRVAEILCPRLESEGLADLMMRVELPLIPVLVDMESAGVRIDTPYLKNLSTQFGENLKIMEVRIHAMAGEPFNINSPKQLAEILFNRLGLTAVKKTKTGLSTSLEVLEELALQHELPRMILDYRSIYKLKSTYLDTLTNLVNPETGRIHTSYNQAVAATGRLSSSDPNLQNIPIRTEEGRKIRQAFVPEDGHVYVAADYSQIELRMVAHISGDDRLKEAFSAGEDIHAITAASIFGCSPAQVVPEMRRRAKEINFGIIYGMGPYKLAGRIGVGLKMARQYLDDYYKTYAGVRRYMEELPERAKQEGFVTTILGRKRFLPDLNNPNKIAQQAAKRMAVNTTIQGSAADIMKLAMIRVHHAIKEKAIPARMILQVHDELVLEVREDASEEAAALLKKEMEGVYPLSVPLEVDTATGKNWDEAH